LRFASVCHATGSVIRYEVAPEIIAAKHGILAQKRFLEKKSQTQVSY
jgi:hypothetical protein